MENHNQAPLETLEVLFFSTDTTWGNQTASRITLCNTDRQPLISLMCIFPKDDSACPFISLPTTLSAWKNWQDKEDTINALFKGTLACLRENGFNSLELARNVVQMLKSLGVQENLFQKIDENPISMRIKTDLTETDPNKIKNSF